MKYCNYCGSEIRKEHYIKKKLRNYYCNGKCRGRATILKLSLKNKRYGYKNMTQTDLNFLKRYEFGTGEVS